MGRPGPGHPPPEEMTVAELEAAVAALPGKRDALREAFDRLAACSPSPLSFAWEDIDAHVSSLHSSISLRFRQVRALDAARATAAAAAPGETCCDCRGEDLELEEEGVEVEEEVVEEDEEVVVVEEEVEEEVIGVEEELVEEEEEVVEVEEKVVEEEEEVVEVEEEVFELEEEQADEEMQEGDDGEADDKIGKDGKDEEEAREVVLHEKEAKVAADNKIGNDIKDGMEARKEGQDADEEMQVANEEQSTKYTKKASLDNEEEQSTKDADKASQGEERDIDMEEAATKKASTMQLKEDEACGEKQEEKEEQEAHEEEGAKNIMKEVTVVTKEVSQGQGTPSLPGELNDHTTACANMDAQRLVKLIFTTTGLNSEFHAAVHHAPDAGALALRVVELFLHDKMLKTNNAWMNCVGLIRMVPVFATKPCADTIEQAKRVARDWNEMTRNPGSCMVIGRLASWGLLYFLISYNIVSDFETKEIFRLFCNIPRKQKKMNYGMLFKGLGLTDRIPELMDYLIGNGQQMDALYFARVFNLVEKYPLVYLLKGYVEKAKQTAVEISQKNTTRQSLNAVITKELDNLRRAHDVAKQQITDSSLSTSIGEEINSLLGEFRKRKQSLANSSTASVSNSQEQHVESNKKQKKKQEQEQHMESNKKHKKEQEQELHVENNKKHEEEQEQHMESNKKEQEQEQHVENKKHEKQQEHHMESKKKHKEQEQEQKHHEGKESQQQGQKNKPGEKLEKKQDKPQQKPKQQKQEDTPQERRQQSQQQHAKRTTRKPPARASPAARNAPLRGQYVHPPYADATIHGFYQGYPAQPSWPGVHWIPPQFAPQLVAPEYMVPFSPSFPHPEFYRW